MLSHEGQTFLTRKGRLPTRPDVATNPPGVMDVLRQKKIIVTMTSADEQRKRSRRLTKSSGRAEILRSKRRDGEVRHEESKEGLR